MNDIYPSCHTIEPVLRVLTANLYNGRADPEAVGDLIDATQPDVVAAQELAPNAAEVIARRLPHGLLLPAIDHSGAGLATRRPIDARRQPLPHRDAVVGRVDDLTIWSVHLANPVGAPPPIAARRAQVTALAELLAGARRTLLVGDLNATPAWPAYRALTRSLDDGVAEWALRCGHRPRPTWSYRPWLPPVLRIDHALVADLKVVRADTARVEGSDHRALIVDIE